MKVRAIIETSVYAADLEAAERFYTSVLGLAVYSRVADRHVFFRCGQAMFLVFQPETTSRPGNAQAPTHGAAGPGHVAFAIRPEELEAWRGQLARHGVTIEAEITWPRGGKSLYFRDPAGNSVELTSPSIWGIDNDAVLPPGAAADA